MAKKIVVAYSQERYSINQYFAAKLINRFNEKGANASLVIIDNVPSGNVDADICVMRSTNYAYSKALSERGIIVFNDPKISEICNDKYKTIEYLASNNIKTLKSVLFDGRNLAPLWMDKFPFVAKSRFGHGGTQVFMCGNYSELIKAYEKIGEEIILLQECASVLGKDVRVYVMNRNIVAAVLRSSDIDFRSNFSLGGNASLFELSHKEKELVLRIAELFPHGFIGIDFLFHNNEFVINEIEDVVGTRMLYELGICDAAIMYADNILDQF